MSWRLKHVMLPEQQVDWLMTHGQALTQQAVLQKKVQRKRESASSLGALGSEAMQWVHEVLRGLEDKRTADVCRLVDVQVTALATRSDVDAFAQGKRSKGSGTKKCCRKTGGNKSHWARYCRGPTRRCCRERNDR